MIVLVTDFGLAGPYVGQMKALLYRDAPGVPVVDLFHDVPAFEPMLAAYLLPAYVSEFPAGTVFLCVVDPGVGGDRAPLMLRADGRWFVGPDNGLFAIVARRTADIEGRAIDWRPDRLSASFHGRDLFAPVAARLATGQAVAGRRFATASFLRPDWPDELARVVYIDNFGNAMTGTRAAAVGENARLEVAGRRLDRARTFGDVPPGAAFWYENANGLAEIAVNRGRAADELGIEIGMVIAWGGVGD